MSNVRSFPSVDSDSYPETSRPIDRHVTPSTRTKRTIAMLRKEAANLTREIKAEEARARIARIVELMSDKLVLLRNVDHGDVQARYGCYNVDDALTAINAELRSL